MQRINPLLTSDYKVLTNTTEHNEEILDDLVSFKPHKIDQQSSLPLRLRNYKKLDQEQNDNKKINAKHKSLNFIEKELTNEETLQSLALKYSCNIGEIKRLNNIQVDNEAFCKGKIKIPLNIYNIGVIEKEKEELLKNIKVQKQNLKLGLQLLERENISISHLDINSQKVIKSTNHINNEALIAQPSILIKSPAEEYLENIDSNLNYYSQKVIPYSSKNDLFLQIPLSPKLSSTPLTQKTINESTNLLCNKQISPCDDNSLLTIKQTVKIPNYTERWLCFPSECGMKLWILLSLMLLVCIAVPVIVLWHFINVKYNEEHNL